MILLKCFMTDSKSESCWFHIYRHSFAFSYNFFALSIQVMLTSVIHDCLSRTVEGLKTFVMKEEARIPDVRRRKIKRMTMADRWSPKVLARYTWVYFYFSNIRNSGFFPHHKWFFILKLMHSLWTCNTFIYIFCSKLIPSHQYVEQSCVHIGSEAIRLEPVDNAHFRRIPVMSRNSGAGQVYLILNSLDAFIKNKQPFFQS